MLKHRLLVGVPMAVAAVGLLATDSGRMYPLLLLLVVAVGSVATVELRTLLPAASRPHPVLLSVGVCAVLAVNWVGDHTRPRMGGEWLPSPPPTPSWPLVLSMAAGVIAVALGRELWTAARLGRPASAARVGNSAFAVVYLGLLPSCLIRLRWLPPSLSDWALLATVFVPKVGDIGAYFTGRLIGRRPLAPRISPKKTWEGFYGGMVAAASTAVGVWGFEPRLFPLGWPEAALFGLVVGTAGVVGDLFESWLKRRAMVKDASAALPGFGGVLDVIDSVLFAAPVAYLWFAVRP